jgi:ribonucleoside-diphosphate reductase alpha chain
MALLNLSENSLKVLNKRYLKRDINGNVIESPEEMFRRVANVIASADKLYDPDADIQSLATEFYEIMTALMFIPNSPTLMNSGRDLGQLSACFVLPVEDSMESIFEAIKNTALIHKSGGGTGFSFSRIRPKNDTVQSTKGVSSGPVSFMTVFDAATETIKQGGTRRGANMGILRCDHPDILDFIVAKNNNERLNNFNISVGITEEFMEAVKKDLEYDLINPRTKKAAGKVRAREVFDLIVENAWMNGEPGIIFLDRLNKDNPTPKLGEIESTNPCGEQPLLPYESCNLGSINLSKFVSNGEIDYEKLSYIVRKAVHFLDNVIDVNKYPLKIIEERTKGNRKIGLGVMGFADMLIKLNIPYNSRDAISIGRKIMKFLSEEGRKASMELAGERGVFPNFDYSIYKDKEIKIRNATVTTIAPTGTISIIANCSSGIEPIFAISYVRNVLDNDELIEVHPLFEDAAKKYGFYSNELMKKIAKTGSIKDISEIPEDIKKIFVTAHDISPEWHIRMQAAFQEYTDNAVSKTVNLPHDATKEDVKRIYFLAYELNCKGVTVYRDRSRDTQVLSVKPQAPKKRQRPKMLSGKTISIETGCGPLYVTINEDNKGLFELFNNMGKAGGCTSSQSEAIGRLVSLAWRSGISPHSIIKQLIGISCHKQVGYGENRVLSCSDAIAKAIQLYLNSNGADIPEEISYTNKVRGACPECGGTMEYEGGCSVCKLCGYSECD